MSTTTGSPRNIVNRETQEHPMTEPKTPKTEIMYVFEDWPTRIANDVLSVAVPVVLMGIGVWLESGAMQWFGFILASLWVIGRVKNTAEKYRMTPQEAANRIAERFGVFAERGEK